MLDDISCPTPEIACHHRRWARNRTVIAGEDAIKGQGELFLPRLPSQSSDQYKSYVASVDYFPAAQRTLESYVGLIFRKPESLDADDAVKPILATISPRLGLSHLARKLVHETGITNFTGLVVDFPPSDGDVSAAAAIDAGRRPFLSIYEAESVLEVTQSVVRNRFALTRVRLLDDRDTVRELIISDGIYQVVMHRRGASGWVADAPIVPLKNQRPLTAIPFEIVSTEPGCTAPPKAMLDDICGMNVSHYRASAQLCNVLRHIGNPVIYVAGVPMGKDGDGNVQAPTFSTAVDQAWVFSDPATKVGYLEHSGNGVAALRQRGLDIADNMAAIGARVLASEKAAAEAAETLAIRRASENSILAALAIRVSDQIERQVNFALDWVGLPAISFTLNTDFLPATMDPQMIAQLLAAVQAGRISPQSFHAALQEGEVIDPKRSYEDERDLIAQDVADRPPVDTGF